MVQKNTSFKQTILEIIDAHLNKENEFLESSIDENIFME